MRIATVWQNLDQITARYGHRGAEILGNSLTTLVLGPIHDPGTREHLVALLDAERVDEITYDVDSLGGRRARSSAHRDRDKVTAQTLQQLALGEGLLIASRELPARGRVLPYWQRRDLKALIEHGKSA
ncbi:hypothetical protein DSM112329_00170 [Paraconexibacter sp. AEG42_29]|uniref:Uncharacterized protein n=1 Tax=Paraconexibacter sp. AEG42_29 TaxID=2997339 RepID=A0AAU7ANV8_9ACTN